MKNWERKLRKSKRNIVTRTALIVSPMRSGDKEKMSITSAWPGLCQNSGSMPWFGKNVIIFALRSKSNSVRYRAMFWTETSKRNGLEKSWWAMLRTCRLKTDHGVTFRWLRICVQGKLWPVRRPNRRTWTWRWEHLSNYARRSLKGCSIQIKGICTRTLFLVINSKSWGSHRAFLVRATAWIMLWLKALTVRWNANGFILDITKLVRT